tara:strand:+ start:1896 stop:3353 length:1458 start_codon:yes stop_codon:yes gene_type:complete
MRLFLLVFFFCTSAFAETAHINYTDTNMYNKLKGELEGHGFTVTGTNSGSVTLSHFTNKDLHINIAGNNNCGGTCKTAYETYIGAGGTVLIAGNGDRDGNRTLSIESLVESKLSVGAITIHTSEANYTSHANGSQYTTSNFWVTRNLFSMQSGGTAIASNTHGGSSWKTWAVYGYGSNGGKLIITLDQAQFNSTNSTYSARMYTFFGETLEEEGVFSSTPSTSTSIGTSSGISSTQTSKISTASSRATTASAGSNPDNSVYIDQAGNNNTINILQDGSYGNHIRGIGVERSDIDGNSNNILIKQGAPTSWAPNLIELMLEGDSNDLDLFQDRNDDGTENYSRGDHIIKLNVDGNLNAVEVIQRATGTAGHYADIDVTGNSSNFDVLQKDASEKQLFIDVTGNSNIIDVTQQHNSSKFADITLNGNAHDVTILQKGLGAHNATIDLTYGSASSTVDLTQQGDSNQSYSLTQTCYTDGGCSVSVTQE